MNNIFYFSELLEAMKNFIVIISILPFLCKSVSAQIPIIYGGNLKDEEDDQWHKGSITLNDGSSLQGLIRYNDNINVVLFDDGSIKESLSPKSVAAFEFYDELRNCSRSFYSLPYNPNKTKPNSIEQYTYFELLKDFGKVAVLIKAESIDVKYRTLPTGTVVRATYAKVSHPETIFFLEPEGLIFPYATFTSKESIFVDKEKGKIHEDDLLIKYFTEPVYNRLKAYAKENDLTFKAKEDFLKIMDFCETLMKDK